MKGPFKELCNRCPVLCGTYHPEAWHENDNSTDPSAPGGAINGVTNFCRRVGIAISRIGNAALRFGAFRGMA